MATQRLTVAGSKRLQRSDSQLAFFPLPRKLYGLAICFDFGAETVGRGRGRIRAGTYKVVVIVIANVTTD